MTRKKLKSPSRRKGDMPSNDDSKIMREVVRNPIAAAEEARDKYAAGEDTWRREKYEVLAVVYALGQYLKYHGTAWRQFIKVPFFADRKRQLRPIKDQPQAMRHAAYWVLNANTNAKQDRAAAYVRGLQVLARRAVRADDVVKEIIKSGGIDKLIKKAKTDPIRPQNYQPPEDKDYYIVTDGPEVHELEEEVAKPAREPRLPRSEQEPDGPVYKAFVRGCDPEGRSTVEFETSVDRKERLFKMVDGQEAIVRIVCRGTTKDGWLRLQVNKLKRKKLAD